MFIRNILPLIVLLLAGISGYMYVYPKYASITSLWAQEAKYESALETASQVTALSQSIEQNIEAIPQGDRELLDVLLPTEINKLKMGNDIVSIAKLHNITLDNISFQEDDSTFSVSAESADMPANIELQRMAVTIDFVARYSVFKTFLADLERSLQILDIAAFTVTPGVVEPYQYSVTIYTYWLPSST